jgi:hypothetical protein
VWYASWHWRLEGPLPPSHVQVAHTRLSKLQRAPSGGAVRHCQLSCASLVVARAPHQAALSTTALSGEFSVLSLLCVAASGAGNQQSLVCQLVQLPMWNIHLQQALPPDHAMYNCGGITVTVPFDVTVSSVWHTVWRVRLPLLLLQDHHMLQRCLSSAKFGVHVACSMQVHILAPGSISVGTSPRVHVSVHPTGPQTAS